MHAAFKEVSAGADELSRENELSSLQTWHTKERDYVIIGNKFLDTMLSNLMKGPQLSVGKNKL